MNKAEARQIIEDELGAYRAKPYSELVTMIGAELIVREVAVHGDRVYQIEIEAFWDDRPNGNIRVSGAIDDGGLSAYFPLTASFIKSPAGEFVGE